MSIRLLTQFFSFFFHCHDESNLDSNSPIHQTSLLALSQSQLSPTNKGVSSSTLAASMSLRCVRSIVINQWPCDDGSVRLQSLLTEMKRGSGQSAWLVAHNPPPEDWVAPVKGSKASKSRASAEPRGKVLLLSSSSIMHLFFVLFHSVTLIRSCNAMLTLTYTRALLHVHKPFSLSFLLNHQFA
jgi:hypothetical protein